MEHVKLIPSRKGIVDEIIVKVMVQPPVQAAGVRKPVAAVVVMDASDSMNDLAEQKNAQTDRVLGTGRLMHVTQGHGITKLESAKRAAERLLDALQPGDRFGLVIFANDPVEVVKVTKITAASREKMRAKVQAIRTLGMTNLEGGLGMAYQQFDAEIAKNFICRATVLSDGQANVGSEDPEYIGQMARVAAARGIVTSAAGIGISYDARLMMALANAGGGNYAHLKNEADLTALMNKELSDIGSVTCRKATLTLTATPGARVEDNLGGIAQETVPHGVKVLLGDMAEARAIFFRIHGGPIDELELSATVQWVAMDDVPETHETKLSLPLLTKAAWDQLPADEEVIKQASDVIMAYGERIAFSAYDRNRSSSMVGQAMRSTRSVLDSVAAQSAAPGAVLASYNMALDDTEARFKAQAFSVEEAKMRGAVSYGASSGRMEKKSDE